MKCLMYEALRRWLRCVLHADRTFVEASKLPGANTSSVGRVTGRHCALTDGSGRSMEDGQSWWDGCRRCFCHDGHEMCALITCPTLRCINPVLRKHSCCPTCPGRLQQTLTPFTLLHSLSWWRGSVVERWSLAGHLFLCNARPAADGWPLMCVNCPLRRGVVVPSLV